MTKMCVVCKKQPVPGDFTRSFHKFPTNSELKQKWTEAIGIKDIKKVSTVCSDHFQDDSYHQTYEYTKTRRLLSTVVPVLYKSNAVLKEIINNIAIQNSIEEDFHMPCTFDKHVLKNRLDSSSNTNNIIRESSIRSNTASCIDESYVSPDVNTSISESSIRIDTASSLNENDVWQNVNTSITSDIDMSFFQPQSTEMIPNDKSSINFKRSITDASRIPKKKFCFMDGCQPSHVSREDFVSEEAWGRFIKLMIHKNSQIAGAKKRSWRRGKQISNFKESIRTLKNKNASAAAEYLEVLL